MNRNKFKKAAHIVAALIFMLFAYRLIEHNADLAYPLAAVVLATIFLSVAGLHQWFENNATTISVTVIYIEAVSMLLLGFILKRIAISGGSALILAGVLFGVLALYFSATTKRRRHKKRRHRHHHGNSSHKDSLHDIV